MARRIDRVEEACKEELSEIIQREIKDPRIGFVTITRVKVSPDLRRAQVYVSVLGSEEEVKKTLEGLESAKGFMRAHLGKHLRLKFLPEITILHETVAEEAIRLMELMKKTKADEAKRLEASEVRRAAEIIASRESALLVAHQNPDGDAVGSLLGLSIMLEKEGYSVEATWPGPFKMPGKYEFLPGAGFLRPPEVVSREELVITLDCANVDRLQELEPIVSDARDVINIDHHPDNSDFGTVNLVDEGASATAEILYLNAGELGIEVGLDSAICLYTGIVTDTGRFQFSNTTATTLRAAGEMVGMGVDPYKVFENVYQGDSMAYIRLSGKVMGSAVYDGEIGLVRAYLNQADLSEYGVEMEETEDLIDSIRSLKGHRIAALFKELTNGKIRVSLRSRRDVDIGSVARMLGGGGHKVAAGYTSDKGGFEEAYEELREVIIESGWNTGD